jgi:hypothetical protein
LEEALTITTNKLPSASSAKVALESYRYFEMRGKGSEYGRILPAEEKP